MSRLSEALGAGKFVVTGEIGPPKGIDTKEMEEEVHHLRDHVVAVNVTDLQSSVMRLGALAVSAKLVTLGVEPVFQVTCRDRNRLALESDLLSAAWMGIENVLALTGDHVVLGDHPTARPVFDLDSVSLLQAMVTLEGGKDLAGNDLQGAPRFFKGAVVPPPPTPWSLTSSSWRRRCGPGPSSSRRRPCTSRNGSPASWRRWRTWASRSWWASCS